MIDRPVNEKNRFFRPKNIAIAGFIIFIVLCYTVIGPWAKNPDTYQRQTAYLDNKQENAKMLTLGATSASFVISLLPDDSGTPIANELSSFTKYLIFITSVVFLEQYLITAIGFVSAYVILPLSALLAIIALLISSKYKTVAANIAARLLIFGICLALVIPLCCLCGQMIEEANARSIDAALNDARNANSIIQSVPQDADKKIFEKVGEFFSGLWNSATEAYEWAKGVISDYISSIAVMLVTTIGIPILIFITFIFLIKFLTGKDFLKAIINAQHELPDNRNAPSA